MICQATRTTWATQTVSSCVPAFPYQLCDAARQRLEARALYPIEWLNLAAIHGPTEDRLSDNYYDQYGSALFSDVIASELEQLPSFEKACGDIRRTVDFATAWEGASAQFDCGNTVDDLLKAASRTEIEEEISYRIDFVISINAMAPLLKLVGRYYGSNSYAWAIDISRRCWAPETVTMLTNLLIRCCEAEIATRHFVEFLSNAPTNSLSLRNYELAVDAILRAVTPQRLSWAKSEIGNALRKQAYVPTWWAAFRNEYK